MYTTETETRRYTSEFLEQYLQIHNTQAEEIKGISHWASSNKIDGPQKEETLKSYLRSQNRTTIEQSGAGVLFLFIDSPLATISILANDTEISDLVVTADGIKGIRGSELLFTAPIHHELFRYIINALQSKFQQRLGPEVPFMNVQSGNARINVVYEKLSTAKKPVLVMRIDQGNTINPEVIDAQLEYEQRKIYDRLTNHPVHAPGHIFVGITGSGKTTLLRWFLSKKKDNMSNLITIEDVDELKIPGATGFVRNTETSISELFVNSLRQAPSSLVIGEARDEVLLDILEAGLVFPSFTTLHSNTFTGFLLRCQLMTRNVIQSRDLMKLMGEVIGGVTIMRDRRPYQIWELNSEHAECVWGDGLGDKVNLLDWA